MSVYLDASVVVPLFVGDAHTSRVEAWLAVPREITLSVWTIGEFSSALSLRVRTDRMTVEERQQAEAQFDVWLRDRSAALPIQVDDFMTARKILRDDVSLRAPDALHLAAARNLGLELATLDVRLAAAALRLGVPVSDL